MVLLRNRLMLSRRTHSLRWMPLIRRPVIRRAVRPSRRLTLCRGRGPPPHRGQPSHRGQPTRRPAQSPTRRGGTTAQLVLLPSYRLPSRSRSRRRKSRNKRQPNRPARIRTCPQRPSACALTSRCQWIRRHARRCRSDSRLSIRARAIRVSAMSMARSKHKPSSHLAVCGTRRAQRNRIITGEARSSGRQPTTFRQGCCAAQQSYVRNVRNGSKADIRVVEPMSAIPPIAAMKATRRPVAKYHKATSVPYCANDWTGNVQTRSEDQRGKP